MKKIYWGDYTSSELGDLIAQDPVVLVPIGAYEQHGPHLALNTDMVIGQKICEGIVSGCDAPCATLPSVWCGISEHHMKFPGSLTQKHASMSAYLYDILESLARHGVHKVLVVNSHGGNMVAANEAITRVAYSYDGDFALLTYWNLLDQTVKAHRKSAFGGMSHACELETSLQLFLAPENVRNDRIPAANNALAGKYWSAEMFTSNKITMYVPYDKLTRDGHIGDPQLATADLGKLLFETACLRGAELVQDMYLDRVRSKS